MKNTKNEVYVTPVYVEDKGQDHDIKHIIAKMEMEFHQEEVSHQINYLFEVINKSGIYNDLMMKPTQFFFDVKHKFNASNVKNMVTLVFDKKQYSFGFVCNHIPMIFWLNMEGSFSVKNSTKFILLCHKFMENCKFDRFGYFGDPLCDHLTQPEALKQWEELKKSME